MQAGVCLSLIGRCALDIPRAAGFDSALAFCGRLGYFLFLVTEPVAANEQEGVCMKIYILCDMEGTSGIWRPEQVQRDNSQYADGRQMLIADVNAAVAGAFEGGAAEVVVCDTHGGGPNFILEDMDPRANYETPALGNLMPSLNETFAGVMLTGHHAMAGTLNGFLDHTMDSGSWLNCSINGMKVGEIGIETAFAGHYGVPLILVTGDECACAEAERQFPGVVTASVKRGLGRNRATCQHPEQARKIVREKSCEAVQSAGNLKPWRIQLPATIELEYYRSDYADNAASRPGVERVNARTVRKVIHSALDVVRF
jgi:D-amino peptidase